jgi:DNA polymerase-3 subunit delta'
MPVLEIAKFAAKSLLCENSDTACMECEVCKKIDENNFLNFIVINGEDKNISKSEVQTLIDRFSINSVEENSTYVYIINQIERSSTEAINAILKFLEEPLLNVHAIITTKNIAKVLPTIISRCEVINLSPINKQNVIDKAIEVGVAKEDAEFLSYFYVDELQLKEFSQLKEYLNLKTALIHYLEALIDNPHRARFILQTEVLDSLKTDYLSRFFFDAIIVFLKESINLEFNICNYLKTNETLLKNLYNKIRNIDTSIFSISELKNNLDLNINKTLLLEQIHNILKR